MSSEELREEPIARWNGAKAASNVASAAGTPLRDLGDDGSTDELGEDGGGVWHRLDDILGDIQKNKLQATDGWEWRLISEVGVRLA